MLLSSHNNSPDASPMHVDIESFSHQIDFKTLIERNIIMKPTDFKFVGDELKAEHVLTKKDNVLNDIHFTRKLCITLEEEKGL